MSNGMFEFLLPISASIVASFALLFSAYNLRQARRRTRRKLVNTVYYHVAQSVKFLLKQQKNNPLIQEKIKNDNSYTPYGVSSSNDDLTYEHIIDVMEWLSEDEKEAVSSYFHAQMALRMLIQSFNTEFVRGWTPDRKLELWKVCEEYQKETLKCAEKAKKFLEEHRFLKRANGRKTNPSPGPK